MTRWIDYPETIGDLRERNTALAERVAVLTSELESSRLQCAEMARERDGAREAERLLEEAAAGEGR